MAVAVLTTVDPTTAVATPAFPTTVIPTTGHGLGLISVFGHHGRKRLGLHTSSTKVVTRHSALMPTVTPIYIRPNDNFRFYFSVIVTHKSRHPCVNNCAVDC